MNPSRLLPALAALMLFACPAPPTNPTPDSGEGEVIDYQGDSTGNLPDFDGELFDAGNKVPIDAGAVTFDMRCCKLGFRIDLGNEPADAVAQIVGEASPLSSGVPLTKGDAGYSANVCFPMKSSSYYWYQFEFTTADADAGGLSLGDAGFRVTQRRHSPYETNYTVSGDETQNFIPSVMSCSELDAGMGP